MDLRFLKKVRVVLSIVFVLSITTLYLDLSFTIQAWFSEYPLYLQFIPSLLTFVSLGTIAGLGFLFVLILTLLFGRVYCSTICPLGVFQDVINYLRNKLKPKYFSITKAFTKTRYILLSAVSLLLILGFSFGINLLDPYSNYGRIISNVFRPLAIGLNNLFSSFLELFGSYALSPLEFKGVELFSVIFSLFVLVSVVWLSYNYGRLFCNSICPVGTMLGLLSKISIFKVGIIESNCIECGECETVCKASCIESDEKFIDFSRCVGCFNCFDTCPSIGISYVPRYSDINETGYSPEKRNFFKNIGVFLLSTSVISKAQKTIEVYVENTIPVLRKSPVSPPGSISIENFTSNCTACHLCVSSCPTQVLQPSFLEYGLLGIMQPRMDYKTSYCNYDCTICTEVCPSGAIIKQPHEEKKQIQMGKAKFEKENCVVYTQKTDCGACAEHCPTKAVKMVLDIEVNKNAPLVTDEICVGCGACEFACPTKPYKAIYIEGNPIHKIAEKPKEEELDEVIDHKEDFPF